MKALVKKMVSGMHPGAYENSITLFDLRTIRVKATKPTKKKQLQ